MSSSLLSIDLRKRVIAAFDSGTSATKIALTFNVSKRVIYSWLDLRRKTGSIEPIVNYRKGHSHKITDLKEFLDFVKVNHNKTAGQMRNNWEKMYKIKISLSTIMRNLKKINYSCKKKLFLITKQTQKKDLNI